MEKASEQFSFARIVRWAIPGWVAVLAFAAFVSLDILGAGANETELSRSVVRSFKTLETEQVVPGLVTLLLIAAAGVPLGFVIYQVYFFLKWNSPFSRKGLLPPFIVGGIDDLDRMLGDIDPKELILNKDPWREKWISHPMFKIDHSFRWRYVDLVFTQAAQAIDTKWPALSLYSRYRYVYELMHLLGVSLVGVYLGFLSYLIYKVRVESRWHLAHVVFVVTILAVFLWLMSLEDSAKRERQASASPSNSWTFYGYGVTIGRLKLVFEYPASLCLIALGVVLFTSHPTLAPKHDASLLFWDLLLRIALVVLAAFRVWPQISGPGINGGRIGILFSLILGIVLFFYRDRLLGWFDWPFSLATYIFVAANLIFVKNRQNARDDSQTLQYYTLRRYLSESQEGSSSQ